MALYVVFYFLPLAIVVGLGLVLLVMLGPYAVPAVAHGKCSTEKTEGRDRLKANE